MTPDPTNDQPRWTFDVAGGAKWKDEFFLVPSREIPDAYPLAPGGAVFDLRVLIRDAAEVPALRARFAEWVATADRLTEERDQAHDRAAALRARLEAAQNEITDLRSGIRARKHKTENAKRSARREQENAAVLAARLEAAEAVIAACKAWGPHTPRRVTRALLDHDGATARARGDRP